MKELTSGKMGMSVDDDGGLFDYFRYVSLSYIMQHF
jgi:hypothetical protein